MADPGFELVIDERIAHLRLNRPDALNAMTSAFFSALRERLEELRGSGTARVLVLSSTGRHFTAGLSLDVFAEGELPTPHGAAERARFVEMIARLQDAFTALERLPMPVIAAIQGGCIGGGVDLAAACDIRYAAADAFFCIQEINIGIAADLGTLQRLPKLVPDGVVREYAFSGRRMSAARARELGLVNEVFATQEEMLAAAMALAREIAAKAPAAIWASKQAITHARDHAVPESLAHMALLQAAMWAADDVREAVAAAREKRAARFDDLPPDYAFGR